jgi:primosomal protein N' (replication factor Y)
MNRYAQILVNVPVCQSFTYKITELIKMPGTSSIIIPGMRAEVMFGSRKVIGFIIELKDSPPDDIPADKIKPVLRIIDEEPVFTLELIELSRQISQYYLCSQGEALSAMIPSGKRESSSSSFIEEPSDYVKKELSEEQNDAVTKIIQSVNNKNTLFHYLYGTTGSGKTEVFLQIAQYMLNEGKGVIYLVPEIGLTHQVVEEVKERFGNTAAVLHSGLTGSKKLSEWKRIIRNEARVVIGARSAVFAPVSNLGAIILDEEHDTSYKSGNTPRYHARQTAMMRCSKLQIPLIMGSATPSVEAWLLMNEGVIQKLCLTKRLSGGKPPEIEVVNLSCTKEDCSSISKTLEKQIREVHAQGRQTILFLNRRGFTHFFKCSSCGFELTCKNCSVSLTYHASDKRLRCHYCGYSITQPSTCPECGSLDIGYFGFGTEFIENEVKAKFPDCTIERIDSDSLDNRDALEEKLEKFRQGKTDILLGTQMIAKGLNFPNLKLVGVILADTGLHLPDFRAAERTFSLLVQVAGRAGRFFPDGKVIVQSFYPDRPAIKFACTNDIQGFYDYETEQRKLLFFPPFSRLIRLVFRSAQKHLSEQASSSAYEVLEKELDQIKQKVTIKNDYYDEILGPSECPLAMIAANYRFQIVLRATTIPYIHQAVYRFINFYKPLNGVYIEVDVDPVSLL